MYVHKTEEQQEKAGGSFLSWTVVVKYEIYALRIQFPDGSKKILEYDRQKHKEVTRNNYIPNSPDEVKRIETVQQVVNDLENQGYSVPADQLALFMQGKIELLIMQKN